MAVRVILSCLQAEASFLKAVFWRKTRLSFLLCAAAIVKTRTGLFNLSNYREIWSIESILVVFLLRGEKNDGSNYRKIRIIEVRISESLL